MRVTVFSKVKSYADTAVTLTRLALIVLLASPSIVQIRIKCLDFLTVCLCAFISELGFLNVQWLLNILLRLIDPHKLVRQ